MKKNRYKKLSLGSKKQLMAKMTFTFVMVAIFKLLSYIPVPFINISKITDVTSNLSIFQTAQMFSGHAVSQLTLMATGVSSYITASIVLQFLTYASKRLSEISRSSNSERIIKRITLVMGILISLITSLLYTVVLSRTNPEILTSNQWYAFAAIAICHAVGTFIAIQIGEMIEKKGYGNGLSLLIAVNVVSNFPQIIKAIINVTKVNVVTGSSIISLALLMVCLIIFMESSEKRLNVIYSKIAARQTGHMQSSKQSLPMKINANGVMPIIISASLLQVITFGLGFWNSNISQKIIAHLSNPGSIYYGIYMLVMIVFFTFIYSSITFDAGEFADGLQKNGGAIVAVRPGKDTKEYLKNVNKKLTKISAIYLFFVSLIPIVITGVFGFSGIQATSLMIIIGVALDTIIKLNNEYSLSKMKI